MAAMGQQQPLRILAPERLLTATSGRSQLVESAHRYFGSTRCVLYSRYAKILSRDVNSQLLSAAKKE